MNWIQIALIVSGWVVLVFSMLVLTFSELGTRKGWVAFVASLAWIIPTVFLAVYFSTHAVCVIR